MANSGYQNWWLAYKDFKSGSECAGVYSQIDVVTNEHRFRVEIVRSLTGDAFSSFGANVYEENQGAWVRLIDFPWVADKDPESAFRSALSFLEDRTS